jgi:integrase
MEHQEQAAIHEDLSGEEISEQVVRGDQGADDRCSWANVARLTTSQEASTTLKIACPCCGEEIEVSLAAAAPKRPLPAGWTEAATPEEMFSRTDVRGGVSLEDAIEAFVLEKKTSGSWSQAWGESATAHLDRFNGFAVARGIVEVGSVIRRDVAAWKVELRNSKSHLGRPLGVSAVNAHLTTLSSFFRWTESAGMRFDNPAKGQKIKGKKRAAQDQRLAFAPDEVGQILVDLVPEGDGARPSRFLLPLLMAYTGARNEEIAQLRCQDVREVDGVLCFDMQTMDEGQRRKSEASRRLVPVHSAIAFEVRAQATRVGPGDQPLLPDVKPDAKGRYAATPSRWFNETYLPKSGIDTDRKTLYSLRHSVATQLKVRHGLPEHTIAELIGHTNESITTGRYGKRFDVAAMQKVVELIAWPLE